MTESGTMPIPDRTGGGTAGRELPHIFSVRVYYEDTDAGGIVYYANYLKFAERARTELLRQTGRQQFDMLGEQGIGFTVRSCQAEFLAPARLDDILEVGSTVTEVLGASMRLTQRIWCADRLLCDLQFRIAVMNRKGRPARIPKDIRKALEARIALPPSGDADANGSACGSTPRQAQTPRDCHSSDIDPKADPI